jgi:hypothetical protein
MVCIVLRILLCWTIRSLVFLCFPFFSSFSRRLATHEFDLGLSKWFRSGYMFLRLILQLRAEMHCNVGTLCLLFRPCQFSVPPNLCDFSSLTCGILLLCPTSRVFHILTRHLQSAHFSRVVRLHEFPWMRFLPILSFCCGSRGTLGGASAVCLGHNLHTSFFLPIQCVAKNGYFCLAEEINKIRCRVLWCGRGLCFLEKAGMKKLYESDQ